MKANYNRRMTNRPNKGLTLNQFIDYYVKGHTPTDWVETIKVMLKKLSIGGKWMWGNAGMMIIRDSENSYSVEAL